MSKKVNKILWHGNERGSDGKAKAPNLASAGGDGTDGLNRGEVFINDADEDPAIFIRTDKDKVARIGGGDGASDSYTRAEVDALLNKKVDNAFFSRLFGLMGETGAEIAVNDVSSPGRDIKAKLGLWTEEYLSALGKNAEAGGTVAGATKLSELSDVSLGTLVNGQALVWNGSKWVNRTIESGLDEEALANYLTTNNYVTQSWATGQFAKKSITITTGTGLTGGGDLSANRTLSLATVGTAGTYTKVTVDAYGRVTGHASLAAGDIPALSISKITGLQSALDKKLDAATFDDLFEKVEISTGVYAIRAKYGLYSDDWVSVMGANPDAGGTSSGVTELSKLSDVSLGTLVNGQALVYDSTSQKWVNRSIESGLDTEELAAYLTGNNYATQSWVTGQGYLKSVSLSTISDLHSSWDVLLKAAPSAYVTRWPTAAEVGALTQATADGRYVTLSTAQTISGAKTFTNSIRKTGSSPFARIQYDVDTSRYIRALQGLASDGSTEIYDIGYHNTTQTIYINPIGADEPWVDTVGKYSLTIGNNKLTYNTYPILHSNNYSTYTVTKTGGGASGTWPISISGNAATASKWATARTITLTGAVTGSVSIDGSGNVSMATTYATGNISALDSRYVNVSGDTMTGGLTVPSLAVSGSTATVAGNKVWHAGNDGSDSGLDADLLDRYHRSTFVKQGNRINNVDWNTLKESYLHDTWSNSWGTNTPTSINSSLYRYGQLAVLKSYSSVVQIYFPHNSTQGIYTRITWDGTDNQWNKWKELALTTSNVASATKLQTARTIWGQSFDGTANVSGNMTGVGSISASGDITCSSVYTSSWFRSTGQTGWYSQTYGGGWYMTDSTWIRTYNNKSVYQNTGQIRTDGYLVTNGGLTVGATSPNNGTYKVHCTGAMYASVGVVSDGYVSAKGANTSSDIRLKTKLSDIALSPKDIANAPSMLFAWKKNGMKDVGSSAQYWKDILPDAVKERDGWLEMAYGNIALVSAISLAKHVMSHEERIRRLEQENARLRRKLRQQGIAA